MLHPMSPPDIHSLIMAPVYFSAFLYVILGVAIRRLGQQYSALTPRMVSLWINKASATGLE